MAVKKNRTKKKSLNLQSKTLGIIGASQLALYLAQAARQSGYITKGMSYKKNDPATSWFNKWTKGKSNRLQDISKMTQQSSSIIFENKTHLDLKTLKSLSQKKMQFFPELDLNTKMNDLWTLKELFYDYELPQTSFIKINGKDDLDQAFTFFKKKMVLKSRFSFKNKQDTFIIKSILDLNKFKLSHKGKESHFIAEEFTIFRSEHRIIIARNHSNEFSIYPLMTLNLIGNNYDVVSTTRFINNKSTVTVNKNFDFIIEKIKKLLTAINYNGVMTFNLFNAKNMLYLNDADARPCNTGMITLDGFNINQFDLHIRAILNLKLPEVIQYKENLYCKYLIAGRADQVSFNQKMNVDTINQTLSKYKNGKLYWYGKDEKRPNRKLGHINYTN